MFAIYARKFTNYSTMYIILCTSSRTIDTLKHDKETQWWSPLRRAVFRGVSNLAIFGRPQPRGHPLNFGRPVIFTSARRPIGEPLRSREYFLFARDMKDKRKRNVLFRIVISTKIYLAQAKAHRSANNRTCN
jgi:hypothetical protein